MTTTVTQAEAWAREIVRARSERCEICRAARALEFSHRISRGQGGAWRPSNGVRACRTCHADLHANPKFAYSRGLMIPGVGLHPDTETVPVYLNPWCGEGWYLLTDEGLYVFTERTTP